MWVARDKSKQLSLWYNKPIRQEHKWYSNDGQFILDNILFPNLTWEDEPVEVRLTTDENNQALYDLGYRDGWEDCYINKKSKV